MKNDFLIEVKKIEAELAEMHEQSEISFNEMEEKLLQHIIYLPYNEVYYALNPILKRDQFCRLMNRRRQEKTKRGIL